jgi:uncharacterized membrane protein YfcA
MVLAHILAMILATLVGLSLGALGGGGSIITIPVLVYVAQVPANNAVVMSLVIVGTTSLIGALLHLQRGNVAIEPSLWFALTGVAGSFLGSTGTHLLSKRSLMLLFAGVMLIVGVVMWRGAARLPRPNFSVSIYRCLLAGFVVGLLTGFLGVGGGFLIVPALVLFANLEARRAAGTSLAVIALNSGAGLLGQLRFVAIDWKFVAGFLAFAIGGAVIGSALSARADERRLRRIFAMAVVALAIAVGIGNLVS